MAGVSSELFYGSAIADNGKAVLITGPSGSGKSDLTLRYLWQFCPHLFEKPMRRYSEHTAQKRCFDKTSRFISDDQVCLTRENNHLVAHPPKTIQGVLEVRNIGLVIVPSCEQGTVSLIVALSQPEDIPRFLDKAPQTQAISGLKIPLIALNPFEISAPLKLQMAMELYGL